MISKTYTANLKVTIKLPSESVSRKEKTEHVGLQGNVWYPEVLYTAPGADRALYSLSWRAAPGTLQGSGSLVPGAAVLPFATHFLRFLPGSISLSPMESCSADS